MLCMKKKIAAFLILFAIISSSLSAFPIKFVFGDMAQHPEITWGFMPTYILAGAGYDGISLIPGHKTQLSILGGVGYQQRKVWQDPVTGKVLWQDGDNPSGPITYDVFVTEWEVRLFQGFAASPVPGKDLVSFQFTYKGRYDVNMDSMKKGKERDWNNYEIQSLEGYLGKDYSGSVYPDLNGDAQMLGTAFNFRVQIDAMDDKKTRNDGIVTKFEVEFAPLKLNNALDGKADYYSFTFNGVAAKTIFAFADNGGNDVFTMVFIDRANLNYTSGRYVPVYYQRGVSLGRKVRGYNPWTYNTEFTAVNNFDIRLSGPNFAGFGIFPRVNLFFDVGYGCGEYFNSDERGDNFLMSTGVQITVSFFDFCDLGYEIAYDFDGYKFSEGPDEKMVGRFTFFLDF